MIFKKSIMFRFLLLGGASFSALTSASAQVTGTGASDGSLQDIIVTARKREETSLSVPVAIAAVGALEMARRGINGIDAIARVVPQLVVAENGGSAQGGTIALRGITGPDNNNFGDQAVSFNIDGFQIAKASVRRLGQMDLAQVEILKGPQALFFGKNSPGGVISIRTADPTDKFEAKLSAGYEFNAHEFRSEGYVSVPITDGFGARIAGYFSDMRGWVENTIPSNAGIFAPKYPFGPRRTEYAFRGTLKYDKGGPFTARLKASYGNAKGAGQSANMQYISCPVGGVPQFPGVVDDCKANETVSATDSGPDFAKFNPDWGDGVSFLRSSQQLYSLELNYDLADHLRLTSVSGLYKFNNKGISGFGYASALAILPSLGIYSDREISEEIRLASSFDGPLNFTIGGIYSDTHATGYAQTFFGSNPGGVNAFGQPETTQFNQYYFVQDGKAYSFFGQLQYKIVPTVELSAGGRYSHESKSLPFVTASFSSDATIPQTIQNPVPSKISFNDFSPEITMSWRPSAAVNLYGSYKRGFLSGGFNQSSDALQPGARPDYGPQKVRGFEAGLKTALLDNSLRLNIAAFNYDVLGLQVNSFEAGISSIRNAAKVRIRGVEADFNYRTPISGLDLHGQISYLNARYKQYIAPCYVGQTQALGCNIDIVGGIGSKQNLAGTAAPNAPNWVLSGGTDYTTPIGSNLKIGVSGDISYSASYVTDSKNTPFSRPPAGVLVDASLRLSEENDAWEVALIGRNLANHLYWNNSQGLFPSGAGTGGGIGTVGVLEDRFASISRSREVMVRVSVKY